MAVLLHVLAAGVIDSSGNALNAGKVYVYDVGTTTKATIYQDSQATVPTSNPVTLSAVGKAEVYVDQPVRLVIETSAGAAVDDIDSIGELSELTGDVTLGTTSANTLDINSRLISDIIPRDDSTFNIGSASLAWAAGYFDDVIVTDDLTVGDDATISGDLNVTGTINANGSIVVDGNITVDVDAASQIGDSTHNFEEIYLDDGVTHGGRVYFNAGGSYLGSSSDGATLVMSSGFTELLPDADVATRIGDPTHRFLYACLSSINSASTPASEGIYSNMLTKAWSKTQAGGTQDNAVNLTVSKTGTGTYDYTFRRAMTSAHYCILPHSAASAAISKSSISASGFTLSTFTDGAVYTVAGDAAVHVSVTGAMA